MYKDFIEKDKESLRKESSKLNGVRIARLAFFALFVYSFIQYFHSNFNNIYLLSGTLFLLVFIILVRRTQKLTKAVQILKLEIQFSENEIESLNHSKYFHADGSRYIDRKHAYTYDLDIFGKNSIYHYINRTNTFIAEKKLADYFIEPDLNNIEERQKSISELSAKFEFRKKLYALSKLNLFDENSEAHLNNWLSKKRKKTAGFYRFLILASPIILFFSIAMYFLTSVELYADIIKFTAIFNLFILGINFKKIQSEIIASTSLSNSLFMLSDVLHLIESTAFESKELNNFKSKIINNNNSSAKKINELANIYQNLNNVQNLLSTVIFNASYLYHIRALIALDKWLDENKINVEVILDTIANVEAISSLANFKYNHPGFCFAEISNSANLYIENTGHPLIRSKENILNTIEFKEKEFKILTGSNMSGKSTFLRTIGINILLSNMGSACSASRMLYRPMPLISSMRNTDSILDKESYFLAEVNRLKLIFEKAESQKMFIILDEILRGTNSDDKLEGSKLIVENLIKLEQYGIIATHDLELCELSKVYPEQVENICFESQIVNNDLYFDYKLKKGICKNKSASFLINRNIFGNSIN